MSSLLHKLENNEAILLMYAADELPERDRAEVERMLDADPSLRASLDQLRESLGAVAEGLGRLDEQSRPPVPRAVAVRRVGRAVAAWHAMRSTAAPVGVGAKRGLRYPWWVYPAAAAASVLLAFLVWWGNSPESGRRGPVLPATHHSFPYDALVGNLTPSRDTFVIGGGDSAALVTRPPLLDPVGDAETLDDGPATAAADPLDEMERELLALSVTSEADGHTWFADPTTDPAAAGADGPDEIH